MHPGFHYDRFPAPSTPKYGIGDDVAGLIAYLASEDSRFAAGAALVIDNGFIA